MGIKERIEEFIAKQKQRAQRGKKQDGTTNFPNDAEIVGEYEKKTNDASSLELGSGIIEVESEMSVTPADIEQLKLRTQHNEKNRNTAHLTSDQELDRTTNFPNDAEDKQINSLERKIEKAIEEVRSLIAEKSSKDLPISTDRLDFLISDYQETKKNKDSPKVVLKDYKSTLKELKNIRGLLNKPATIKDKLNRIEAEIIQISQSIADPGLQGDISDTLVTKFENIEELFENASDHFSSIEEKNITDSNKIEGIHNLIENNIELIQEKLESIQKDFEPIHQRFNALQNSSYAKKSKDEFDKWIRPQILFKKIPGATAPDIALVSEKVNQKIDALDKNVNPLDFSNQVRDIIIAQEKHLRKERDLGSKEDIIEIIDKYLIEKGKTISTKDKNAIVEKIKQQLANQKGDNKIDSISIIKTVKSEINRILRRQSQKPPNANTDLVSNTETNFPNDAEIVGEYEKKTSTAHLTSDKGLDSITNSSNDAEIVGEYEKNTSTAHFTSDQEFDMTTDFPNDADIFSEDKRNPKSINSLEREIEEAIEEIHSLIAEKPTKALPINKDRLDFLISEHQKTKESKNSPKVVLMDYESTLLELQEISDVLKRPITIENKLNQIKAEISRVSQSIADPSRQFNFSNEMVTKFNEAKRELNKVLDKFNLYEKKNIKEPNVVHKIYEQRLREIKAIEKDLEPIQSRLNYIQNYSHAKEMKDYIRERVKDLLVKKKINGKLTGAPAISNEINKKIDELDKNMDLIDFSNQVMDVMKRQELYLGKFGKNHLLADKAKAEIQDILNAKINQSKDISIPKEKQNELITRVEGFINSINPNQPSDNFEWELENAMSEIDRFIENQVQKQKISNKQSDLGSENESVDAVMDVTQVAPDTVGTEPNLGPETENANLGNTTITDHILEKAEVNSQSAVVQSDKIEQKPLSAEPNPSAETDLGNVKVNNKPPADAAAPKVLKAERLEGIGPQKVHQKPKQKATRLKEIAPKKVHRKPKAGVGARSSAAPKREALTKPLAKEKPRLKSSAKKR